jgi:hypothetical protein
MLSSSVIPQIFVAIYSAMAIPPASAGEAAPDAIP